MNDQQDALCRLAKLRELHSHYRQCETNEAIVRANLVELVQKRRDAKHALDDYMDAESKPLPLFDNMPRPEGSPAVLIDTIERDPEPVLDLEAVLEADAELDAEETARPPDDMKQPIEPEQDYPPDRTSFWERYWQERRLEGKPELLAEKNMRVALQDWRKRQAEGDVEPRWDRWSEFTVTVGENSYEVLVRSDLPSGTVLNIWGPGVGPDGFHSAQVSSFGVAPVEFVEELVAELLKPKRKKKGGRS